MLVNQLQCMTPSERFGFLLLWYMSYHGTAIKYAPAMVPHTAAHGGTFVNAVSKQLTLSQVAQLPHCRFQPDSTSQQHNLDSICTPHLQHWQPRWAKPQLFLSCQLFKRMPWHQCLWHLMPLLCSLKDPAMPTWHIDAWSRKSKNYSPGLSTDLVLAMCCCIHPKSFVDLKCLVSYSQKGGCHMIISFSFKDWSLSQLIWLCSSCSFTCFSLHMVSRSQGAQMCIYVNSVLSSRNLPHFTTSFHNICFYGPWKGVDQGKEGQRQSLVDLGTASQGWQTGKLLPGCLAGSRQASLVNEHHIWYTKVYSLHPGQMVYEIGFKF